MNCPCKNCITLAMCTLDGKPNLLYLIKKCALLFGYLNCLHFRDDGEIAKFTSSHAPHELRYRLEVLQEFIPHDHEVDQLKNRG